MTPWQRFLNRLVPLQCALGIGLEEPKHHKEEHVNTNNLPEPTLAERHADKPRS